MGYAFDNAIALIERPRIAIQGSGDSFWNLEPPVLIGPEKRLARGGMFPHQRTLWDLDTFIKVLVGGYGAGKTFIGAKRIIALALENAPCAVAIVSPTFGLARQTVVTTIRELLNGKRTILGRALRWRYNKSTWTFSIWYRGRQATILCYSGEDPDSLRGPNLAAAWLDEPFLMEEPVFGQMIARVRHPEARRRELLMTGTPEQLNWGYDLCMGELKDRYREFDLNVGVVNASTRGNLALEDNYVKRLLGSMTDRAADAYVEGKFVNLGSGLVYYAFDPTPGGLHVKALPIPDEAELGCGMDFNVNPMSMSVFWRAGGHLHFFKEFELENADTEYACSMLYEMFVAERDDKAAVPGRMTKQKLRTIYPDATGNARKSAAPGGKTDFHYIRAAGFEIRAHHENPKRKDRYNAANGRFRPRLGTPNISIDPKCKKLIKYLSTHSHELMHKQSAMGHLLDSFSYPIEYLFPIAPQARQVRLYGA